MNAARSTLRRWKRDPVAFVRECLGVEPDAWQADVLAAAGRGCMRIAMKACKGPGKTTVLAWLVWWFLSTRPYPKIICTSITGDNLSDGLWTELAKWQRHSELLTRAFEWQSTAVVSRRHPEEWYCKARTWPRTGNTNQQADTLAGKHADYMMFVLDEVGGIPDAVMAAAEAGLANANGGGGKEAFIVIAGNPTHTTGPLWRACQSERDMWHVTEITSDPDDPKRTPRVSVDWAREQIKKYGRDNPWVLVNVFGKFPPSSFNTLLSPDDVREAMDRYPRKHDIEHSPRVLGVDVAREGDDRSVMFPRQGRVAFPPETWRNVNSIQGAGAVARKWRDWKADGCFVDNTGGFGGGWLDQLEHLGFTPVGVHFSGAPHDGRYYNKRAEMWFEMSEWIKSGGALPDVPELVAELTEPTYTFRNDKLLLEDKDQIKDRLGRSPDYADGLALTFAEPLAKPDPVEVLERLHGEPVGYSRRGYNPLSNRAVQRNRRSHRAHLRRD